VDLSERLAGGDLRVAVAESLTGGLLASRFARMEGASDWFRGGLVAYATGVKHDVLGVGPVHVVSEPAAVSMAEGVAKLLDADVAVAVTGVGGPGPQDGVEAGTVWMAVVAPGGRRTELHHLPGGPEDVCRATCDAAISLVESVLDGG
jgi:nicotinamide-nucleotide amidase